MVMTGGVADHGESRSLRVEGTEDTSPSGDGSNRHGAGDSKAPSSAGSENRTVTRPNPARRRPIYVGVAVAIAVVAIVLAYALTAGFQHTSGPAAQVILPHGTTYALGGGQSTGITMTVSTTSVLRGTFQTGAWVTLYRMTLTEYASLVKSGNVSGYEWTSGQISSQSYYNLSVSIPVGSWVVVFANPSPTLPIAVTFLTDVTLTPT